MGSKRKRYTAKKYESVGAEYIGVNGRKRKETNCCIFDSMLESEAFISLKPRVKVLYLYCKAQLYGKRKPAKDYPQVEALQNDSFFYFNFALAVSYGLYPKSCESNFYKDMKALTEAGFISLVSSGARMKKKNIYAFSDKWQNYSNNANKPC